MARNVKLNHRGVAALLRSTEMHRMVQDAAEKIADNVRHQGIKVGDRPGGSHEVALPVEVDMTTTDRAHGRVLLPHAAGIAVQAKHGVLTRAASAAGIRVKTKG